ncbi:MAG TPA: hypothetical protein VGP25_11345 [Gemmatimonadaceae bacterium]|nr:hypothetical protein [Gemmatimonadaceae bacterium]
MTFAAVAALAVFAPLRRATGQQVPGRDLFQFPIGTLAEPAALASAAGGGFWNPATAALDSGNKLLLSATALNTPIEQAVSAQLGTVAYRVSSHVTAGLQAAQASVQDLLRTDTDPQSLPGEIPYRSTVVSAIGAATYGPATLGVALRRRSGEVDIISGHATSVDIGGIIDRPAGLPIRLGASTFLQSITGTGDRVTLLGAAEGLLPVHVADVRAGLAYQRDRDAGSETFAFTSARTRMFDLRGGIARQSAFGFTTTRLRLGLGLRYARYLVGVSRDEGTAGLGSTYQFLLTTVFR